jgi:hypothetical protein
LRKTPPLAVLVGFGLVAVLPSLRLPIHIHPTRIYFNVSRFPCAMNYSEQIIKQFIIKSSEQALHKFSYELIEIQVLTC